MRIDFGVLVSPVDPTQGWKCVTTGPKEVLGRKEGFSNNAIVAFRFVGEEEEDEDRGKFEVEWPDPDEAYDEDDEMQ